MIDILVQCTKIQKLPVRDRVVHNKYRESAYEQCTLFIFAQFHCKLEHKLPKI